MLEETFDTATMAICALRYYVGARNYVPPLVIGWVKKYWDTFSQYEQKVMLRSLKSEIESGADLGNEENTKTWYDFYAWMQEKLE